MITLLKTLLTLSILTFFAVSFFTFDLAALNLDIPSGQLLRESPIAMGIMGGILLLAVIGHRRVDHRQSS